MRTDPPDSGPELLQLTAFLDYQRETMLLKTDGLSREQLATPLAPSSLTLAGLLNHLAKVEDVWFRVRFAGLPEAGWRADAEGPAEPDWDFDSATSVDWSFKSAWPVSKRTIVVPSCVVSTRQVPDATRRTCPRPPETEPS